MASVGALFALSQGGVQKKVRNISGEDTMRKQNCEVCGCVSDVGTIEEHHVVPVKFTEQAGIPESQAVRLCYNCHREVHDWYSAKVIGMAYDPKTKQFRDKSSLEMVKEYQVEFNRFVNYKRGQRKADRT